MRALHRRLVHGLRDHPERKEWSGGGADFPGIHSICVDAPGVSCGGVWRSTDDGVSWEIRARGLFAALMPPERRDDPYSRDPHLVTRCPARPDALRAQHHNGVSRSLLPREHAYDIVYRHALDIDATGHQLAFGSTTGSLWLTENQGGAWQRLDANLPPIHSVRFVA